jgi:hypothetical protein
MLLDFNLFYRNYGLRRVDQLMAPRFGHLENFQLPRRAIFHSAHGSPNQYGPSDNDVALQGFSAAIMKDDKVIQKAQARNIWVHHVLALAPGQLGQPSKLPVQPVQVIRQYHQHYRRFRNAVDEKPLADVNSLMVYNYNVLPHLLRYPRNQFNQYLEWYNIERTVWSEIARLSAITDRPQFVLCHVPQVLPARSILQQYDAMDPKKPTSRIAQIFYSNEHLFLGEIWKWFGENRSQSLLGLVPRQHLNRVNLVFLESGQWTVINLGVLDSWRRPLPEEKFENEQERTNLFAPKSFQNHILRFFMSVTQLRSVAPVEVTDMNGRQVLDEDDKKDLQKELATITKVDSGPAVINPTTGAATIATNQLKAQFSGAADDKPDDTADSVKMDANLDASIDAELAEMEKVLAAPVADNAGDEQTALAKRESWITTPQTVDAEIPPLVRPSHEEALLKIAKANLANGSITAAQYRNYEKVANAYKTMQSPDGKMTLGEFIDISPDSLLIKESKTIPDISTVPDKTMLKSSLLDFDKRYTREIMQRDVASMAMCFAQAGYGVTEYDVETVDSLMGAYNVYTVRVLPTDGSASTVRFKLPVIDPDGSYMANGVKYSMRKQRGDIPIRKTAPDTVSLTSYYGKAFIRRSEKKVNNYAPWLTNNLMAKMLDDLDSSITNGHPGDMSDNEAKVPRLYAIIASAFNSFTLTTSALSGAQGHISFEMSFDHTKREALYGKEALAKYEQNGAIIAGISTMKSHYFLIGKSGACALVGPSLTGEHEVKQFSFEQLIGLDRAKAPVDIAVMKIAGASMPLGVILAYAIGLDPMLALLKSKIRRVPAGTRLNMALNEASVVFNDESIVFDKNDQLTGLFLGGFNEYHRHIRRYNVHLFNSKEVYLNVLEADGLGVRYIREMNLFYQMFIDPITHDILVEMKMPTDMRALLVVAGTMLLTDDHPDELDGAFMRLKGYERMAGAVYSEMVRSIRQHNGSAGKSRSALNMDPFAVFTAIQTDPAKTQVNEINPIQNLKEQEAVTYNGTGGRNSRTMTKGTRTYHRNDMGLISTDTVDSSDVAINTSTCANPQFTSLRGLTRPYEESMGKTALLSTAVLLAPGTSNDDMKRANFIGIQHSHTVACAGYHQMPVRTGYEQVVAHRTGDMFAASATQDGKVVSVAPAGIIVQYADGTRQGYEIGRRFGNAAGLTIPHEIRANVKLNEEFKQGRILIYNTGFFEPDILNPDNVVWKAGMLVKTVLMEVPETLEDSSAVSNRITDKLVTKVSKYSDVVVTFDQAISKLVKEGQAVSSEDILCIIEDAVTSQANLFDENSLNTLKLLSNYAPQAKVKGVVERVEVYYHGEKEDMSDSLRSIANASDKALAERFKSTGRKVLTGSVDEAFRVEGEPLQFEHLCVRIYITSDVDMGEGDKGVFANQMKTVVGKKMVGEYKTEKGDIIDAVFGAQSIDNRIVLSPYVIGMYSVLLDLAGQEALAAYES